MICNIFISFLNTRFFSVNFDLFFQRHVEKLNDFRSKESKNIFNILVYEGLLT